MPSPPPEPGSKFVVVSRYTPPNGGKVITHVYGIRANRDLARFLKNRMVKETGNNPNVEYHICKVLEL